MISIKKGSENYTATVVKIKNLYKIEGADKIVRTNIYGNDVVVSNSTKTGDIFLYFCSGTKLNSEFCRNNNLYSNADLNKDVSQKGYLSHTGRVKAIKLKGVISDGLLLPLTSLSYLNVPLNLKEEDSFTDIEGVSICEKYIVPTKEIAVRDKTPKVKLKNLLIPKQLKFHYQTEHLLRNLDKIGTKVVVTRKFHGCLPPNQPIKMFDGSNKIVSHIKKGDEVLGFNHDLNKFEKAIVTEVYNNGKSQEWLKITKKLNGTRLGASKELLFCTPQHKVYIKDKGYIPASEIKKNDRVISFVNSFVVPEEAEEFIIGKILGDGSLAVKQGKRRALSISHKIDHQEYLHHCRNIINIWTDNVETRLSGYGTTMIRSISKENSYFTNLSKLFIKNDKKIFPKGLKLTPIILAYWYMDDGSLTHNSAQKDRAALAICGFTDDESIKNIKNSLEDFGFNNFTIYKDPKGYNRLRFNHSDAFKLFDVISEYIPNCMRYKLPVEYRDKAQNLLFGFNVEETILEEEGVITSIQPFLQKAEYLNTKYDIETSLNNYVSGGILVHNSSGIVSNVLVIRKLSFFEKLLNKLNFNIPTEEYGFIYSSGKPKSETPKGIISDSSNWKTGNQSFYNDDIWYRAYKFLKDKTEKGITLYFEIVGDGIQGKEYTYNFDFHVFVYRITYTNSDGLSYEFSWEDVKRYCKKYGIDYVTEYETTWFNSKEEMVESLQKYLNKSYPDCKIDEGICVRDLDTHQIFKLKSPNFIKMESDIQEKEEK